MIHTDGKFVTLEELEAAAIETALKYFDTRQQVSDALGISRTQLRIKILKYGLDDLKPSPTYKGRGQIKMEDDPVLVEQVVGLRKEGKYQKDIVALTGLTRGTVMRILAKHKA